jgi:hypothetical protein
MKRIFTQRQQNFINIEVFCSTLKNKKGESVMQNRFKNFIGDPRKSEFQNLIEDYAYLGKTVIHLTKDELFELTMAYLEDKRSKWMWSGGGSNGSIDVPVTMDMLQELNSKIYNHQKSFLDKMRAAVVENQECDVSELLDEEIERARNKFGDNEHHDVMPLMLFNTTVAQSQGVTHGSR